MCSLAVCAVERSWLPHVAAHYCQLSPPLESPAPHYDPVGDRVLCSRAVLAFGPRRWTFAIPVLSASATRQKQRNAVEVDEREHAALLVELEHPDRAQRVRWFARALLRGEVLASLQRFVPNLLCTPDVLTKSWASYAYRFMI